MLRIQGSVLPKIYFGMFFKKKKKKPDGSMDEKRDGDMNRQVAIQVQSNVDGRNQQWLY